MGRNAENWLAEETTPAAVPTFTSAWNGAGTVGRTVFFEFPYGRILALNECLEEVSFGGRQRVRSHGSRS